MAEVKAQKRKVYFTRSTGEFVNSKPDVAKEIKVQSPWKPGKSRKKVGFIPLAMQLKRTVY